jgi:TfoX/Sxy family transcriptional regulator of competence genes
VAYDEDLANRIRELISGETTVTEKKMFGGLAFLIGGNMAISASGQGGILVRVDPEESDAIVDKTTATTAVMQGRPMRGWLRVPAQDIRTKRQLSRWVKLGVDYAASLPGKR